MHFSENMPMEELLRSEGVVVEKERVLNFEAVRWNPMVECEIE
jgi:hypothetical protein